MLYSKKYGVDHIKFVHSGAYSAVCASRNDFDCMFAELLIFHQLS
jgi:hypothetical protein